MTKEGARQLAPQDPRGSGPRRHVVVSLDPGARRMAGDVEGSEGLLGALGSRLQPR